MDESPPVRRTLRFSILLRDSFTCQYCGQKAPEVVLQVDHIVPRSLGGPTVEENLITACFDCNQGKKARPIPADLLERFKRPPLPTVQRVRKPKAAKPKRRHVRIKRNSTPTRYLLPVYNGGSYEGKRYFSEYPVGHNWRFIAPDTFIGVYVCAGCGALNEYEHSRCSCARLAAERRANAGYTNAEIERMEAERDEDPCVCGDCDWCDDHPECRECYEPRLRGSLYCNDHHEGGCLYCNKAHTEGSAYCKRCEQAALWGKCWGCFERPRAWTGDFEHSLCDVCGTLTAVRAIIGGAS